jgi:hypothetical protein
MRSKVTVTALFMTLAMGLGMPAARADTAGQANFVELARRVVSGAIEVAVGGEVISVTPGGTAGALQVVKIRVIGAVTPTSSTEVSYAFETGSDDAPRPAVGDLVLVFLLRFEGSEIRGDMLQVYRVDGGFYRARTKGELAELIREATDIVTIAQIKDRAKQLDAYAVAILGRELSSRIPEIQQNAVRQISMVPGLLERVSDAQLKLAMRSLTRTSSGMARDAMAELFAMPGLAKRVQGLPDALVDSVARLPSEAVVTVASVLRANKATSEAMARVQAIYPAATPAVREALVHLASGLGAGGVKFLMEGATKPESPSVRVEVQRALGSSSNPDARALARNLMCHPPR